MPLMTSNITAHCVQSDFLLFWLGLFLIASEAARIIFSAILFIWCLRWANSYWISNLLWKFPVVYFIEQVLECLINVLSRLSTCFKVLHIALFCHVLGFLSRDLSLRSQVCLAAEDSHSDLTHAMFGDGVDPVLCDCLERLSARQIETDHSGLSLPVERRGKWSEFLLPGRVPNYDFTVLYALFCLLSCWLFIGLDVINTISDHPFAVETSSSKHLS